MKSTWSEVASVAGVFETAKVVAHNQAKVTGSAPIAITTDPSQWWYAAGWRLESKGLEKWSPDQALLIRVDATIETGRIGAIFVADDLQEVLGTTDEKSPVDGATTLEIVIDPAPRSGWLVLRNNAPSGSPSRCRVRAIRTFQAIRQKANPDGGLADVMDPGTARINLAKLEAAVASATAQNSGAGILDVLRRKWSEVPAGLAGRLSTLDLARLPDNQLWTLWSSAREEATTGEGYSVRGWYHQLYRDVLRGKRVLDVGAGFGIDGVTFAAAGAHVTFLDIAPSNLQILERLCRMAKVEGAHFHYLQDISSLDALPENFDVIWCQGSMIHAPFSFVRLEAAALLRHLPIGGRWIELAYPRERWEREGRLAFADWGARTDGEGTPWAEWYDRKRLQMRLDPAEFDTVLQFNFHQDDFNWFDLVRRK